MLTDANTVLKWEFLTSSRLPNPAVDLKYPPDDLAAELVKLCFEKALILLPVLHRPSFDRDLKAELHKRDLSFARIYLLVCAIGARYTSDPRVALKFAKDGGEPEIQWGSAGWMFFSQVVAINSESKKHARFRG